MTNEELLKNNPENIEYLYKILLRNIKELDENLTKYLVQDFFRYEDTLEKDIIIDIQVINDMTNLILDRVKEIKNEKGEEYNNYFEEDAKNLLETSKERFLAWRRILTIQEALIKKYDTYKISIVFNKGYDFGFGSCNFCGLNIDYIEKKENVHHHKTIINISTTNGEHFRILKCEEYYKIAQLDLEKYRLNIDREITCINCLETVNEIEKLIDELLIKVGE